MTAKEESRRETHDMAAIRSSLAGIDKKADKLRKDIRDEVIAPLRAIPDLLTDMRWVKTKIGGNGDPGLLSDQRALTARVDTLENDRDFVTQPVVVEVPVKETERMRYQRLLVQTAVATAGGAFALLFSQIWATLAHFLQR